MQLREPYQEQKCIDGQSKPSGQNAIRIRFKRSRQNVWCGKKLKHLKINEEKLMVKVISNQNMYT